MKPRSLADAVAVGAIRLCFRVAVVGGVVCAAHYAGHGLYHQPEQTFSFSVVR